MLLLTGCSASNDPAARGRLSEEDILSPMMTKKLMTGKAPPPKSEDVKAELNTQLSKWWYGDGVGKTATNVGTIIVFPPWALYLLTNAGISLAGYEPYYITDAFPPKTRLGVLGMYDNITSVPGRINAEIAGKPFYSSPSVKPSETYLKKNEKNKESWNSR